MHTVVSCFSETLLTKLQVMMKESLIFFALLIVVLIGFLQAFIGMDSADDNAVTAIGFISTQMVRRHEFS
jgi:hypothetical protein